MTPPFLKAERGVSKSKFSIKETPPNSSLAFTTGEKNEKKQSKKRRDSNQKPHCSTPQFRRPPKEWGVCGESFKLVYRQEKGNGFIWAGLI